MLCEEGTAEVPALSLVGLLRGKEGPWVPRPIAEALLPVRASSLRQFSNCSMAQCLLLTGHLQLGFLVASQAQHVQKVLWTAPLRHGGLKNSPWRHLHP